MVFLRAVEVRPLPAETKEAYPFALPLVQELRALSLAQPVTFLVGENGSGKSTVLEALACAVESITVGSESVRTDRTLADVRAYSRFLKLIWEMRTRKGFFLRAEDFFGYARAQAEIKADMKAELARVDKEYAGRGRLAQGLARMPFTRELGEMNQRYGSGLDTFSHGESFLKLFESRFVPGGLYLLDEPEAPLSPLRQLAFLTLLKQMVAQEAQFIIATHSPLLLAFPGAVIYQFADHKIEPVPYAELEHVTLTRDFLNDPDAFLRHL